VTDTTRADALLARLRLASWVIGAPDWHALCVLLLGAEGASPPHEPPLPSAADITTLRAHVLDLAVDLPHYGALDAALRGDA